MIRLIYSLGFMLVTILASVNSIAQTKKDNFKIDNLTELTSLLEATEPSDSLAGVYLTKMINLSEKEENYDLMADLAIQFFHHPSPSIQTPELKKQVLKRTITHELDISDSKNRGTLHLKLAGTYFNIEQFDSAIVEYGKAIARSEKKDSILISDSYFFRGQARDYKGDLLGGIQDYQTARDIYQSLADEEYVNYVDGGMAILFSKFAIYNEAEKIRNSLISTYKKSKNTFDVAIQLYNQSEDFGKQGRFEDQLT